MRVVETGRPPRSLGLVGRSLDHRRKRTAIWDGADNLRELSPRAPRRAPLTPAALVTSRHQEGLEGDGSSRCGRGHGHDPAEKIKAERGLSRLHDIAMPARGCADVILQRAADTVVLGALDTSLQVRSLRETEALSQPVSTRRCVHQAVRHDAPLPASWSARNPHSCSGRDGAGPPRNGYATPPSPRRGCPAPGPP